MEAGSSHCDMEQGLESRAEPQPAEIVEVFLSD